MVGEVGVVGWLVASQARGLGCADGGVAPRDVWFLLS
jgi:hypothetical protein